MLTISCCSKINFFLGILLLVCGIQSSATSPLLPRECKPPLVYNEELKRCGMYLNVSLFLISKKDYLFNKNTAFL